MFLSGCSGNLNFNGPPPTDYPIYQVTEAMIIKHILVPVDTKLVYEETFLDQENKELDNIYAELMSVDSND